MTYSSEVDSNKVILSENSIYKDLNIKTSGISMWFERWFLSSNAKDIGVLYLIYALFSGLVGTAFSVLIRLELSGPGVQFIADNQLYNSIITAHAIIMSTPLCLGVRTVHKELTNESSCVKSCQDGRIKLYGETQTSKLVVKGRNETNFQVLGRLPDLGHTTSRLTNLIRIILTNGNSAEWKDRADASLTLILSWVLKLLSNNDGIPRKEDKKYARDQVWITVPRNCGITYGNLNIKVPNNQVKLGPIFF
jgi:hypothetical protein